MRPRRQIACGKPELLEASVDFVDSADLADFESSWKDYTCVNKVPFALVEAVRTSPHLESRPSSYRVTYTVHYWLAIPLVYLEAYVEEQSPHK